GTYKVKIDTDSLSTAETTDIEIVLSKKDAYDFKNKVLSLMNDNKSNYKLNGEIGEDYNLQNLDEKIEYDIVYSNKEILKHCFYNLSIGGFVFNLLAIVFLIFVTYKIGDMESILVALMVLGTGCISMGKFFIGDFFKYYNFSIKREDNKLFISYGLFKKNRFTVPVNRINAVNIKQPTMSRIFNRYKSDIVTIGVGDDDSEGAQILLSSKKNEFIDNMKVLIPEINIEEELKLKKQPKSVHIINLVSIILALGIVSLTLYVIHKVFVEISIKLLIGVGVFILIMMCICTYMSYVTKGINLGDESMSLSFGIFSRKISIIKYKKIQFIEFAENPISIKFNLCKANIFILASLVNSSRSLGYYDKHFYEELKNKIINVKANI
ncbi:MAG: PH domain-containing protein, partial [Peptostreptococcaceae bacterium]